LKKVSISFLALFLCSSVHGQVLQQADGTYLSPYCAVGDDVFGSTPGVQSYDGAEDGYAVRKPDGGLRSTTAKRGIGCEVALRQDKGKVFAHVVARRLSYDLPATDKGKILSAEPTPRVDFWEKEIDLTNVDQVALSQKEVPLNLKLVVGVLRTKP
jgi:hypothetical protein